MGKELYACFIDYSKAFDTVNHEQLISSLSGTEVDDNDIAVIAHLYWQQITRIRNRSNLTEPVKIKRGVRQGCVLSPLIFNLYTEHIFRKTNLIPGVKINGHNINNLRYADDTVLIAEDKASLQDPVTAKSVVFSWTSRKQKLCSWHKTPERRKQAFILTIKKLSRSNHLPTLVSLSQMEKSEVELVLLKMHSQRDINFWRT